MLKDDFPLASQFALGDDTVFDCVSIANRCWQTDDSAALSAAHPEFLFRTRPRPRLSSIVYFLSPPLVCPKSAFRRKRTAVDIDTGRSKPASHCEILKR